MNGLKKTTVKALGIGAILAVTISLSPADAHLGIEHAEKWNECLGIDMQMTTSGGKEHLNALWKTAQDMIDVYRNGKGAKTEYKKIQDQCPWFSWGKYNHRLLFHWPFNDVPRNHPALQDQVRRCLHPRAQRQEDGSLKYKRTSAPLQIADLKQTIEQCRVIDQSTYNKFAKELGKEETYTSYLAMLPDVKNSEKRIQKGKGINDKALWTPQDEAAMKKRLALFEKYVATQPKHLYATLGRLQSKRNKNLINAVDEELGIPRRANEQVPHGAAANALATLIYDIHLLHDYDSAAADAIALPSIETLESDIIEKGMKRLAFGRAKSGLSQELIGRFEKAAEARRGRSNKHRARLMLDLIKEYLPQILQDQYGDVLKEKGISIIPQNKTQLYKEAA
ncbi:MAG: hypothetical protein ACOYD9_08380 [Pyramidobacter sp.]|jgi:hypothetical protein